MRGEVLILGVIHGLGYALLAAGLVLAFRSSRVINLAHGQTGALAAVVMAVAVERWGASYWAVLGPTLLLGAGLGALVELSVVRRLRAVPPLMTFVATLGVAQLMLLGGSAIASELPRGQLFPEPPGIPSFNLGAVLVTPSLTALAVMAPVVVAALAVALRRSRAGVLVRAAAANPEAARLAGIPAPALAAAVWGVAGALSALTAILLLPAGGVIGDEAMGPQLLLRALAAAVLAGMTSLPGALLAGLAVGVVDETLQTYAGSPAGADAALLILIALGLLARRPAPLRVARPEAWSAFARWPALPGAAREVPLLRWAGTALGGLAATAAVIAPLLLDGPADVKLAMVACVALVGLSVYVVTGLTGELSLGQFAVAGLGAAAAVAADRAGAAAAVTFVAAMISGAIALPLLALPALRAGGFGMAVLTLGLALAAPSALRLVLPAIDARASSLTLGPLTTATSTGAAIFAVLVLLIAYACVRALAYGPAGRAWAAARDNPAAARAIGVWPAGTKLAALSAGGAIAGAAGGVIVHTLTVVTPDAFPLEASVNATAAAVVGGLGLAAGPLLGAAVIVALPAFVPLSSAALAATAFGWLVLLLYAPGGLAALLEPLRRRAAALLLRLAGHDPALATLDEAFAAGEEALGAGDDILAARRGGREPSELTAMRVTRRFGTVEAVDHVSLTVSPGEIVGLVGPNGAGKTTLADLLSGLERPDDGRVLLGGQDVTRLPAELRARCGLGRSFQDGTLFPTLTVSDVVRLAADRAGTTEAHVLLEATGLRRYRQATIRTLSTGTRRVVELAALLALEPRVLVLDEPSAGLAEPEAEALGRLLSQLRDEIGLGMLLIEHDLTLVEAVADRVLVMRAGRIEPAVARTPAGSAA